MLCYQTLAALLSGCNLARTHWVSVNPVPFSFPFSFITPGAPDFRVPRKSTKKAGGPVQLGPRPVR
jgi:hypothetical protein